MRRARTRHAFALSLTVGLSVLAAAGLSAPQAAAAPPRNVEILGFSLRGNTSVANLVEPGGTIRIRQCRRRLFVYAAFTGIRPGMEVRRVWRRNKALVRAIEKPWEFGRKRRVQRFYLQNALRLPKGTYQVSIKVPGKRAAVARVRVVC